MRNAENYVAFIEIKQYCDIFFENLQATLSKVN